MSSTRLIFILALAFFHVSNSLVGVSLSKALDLKGWQSLISTQEVSFASIHMMFYNGTINRHAVGTIKAAWSAGITDLSIFMHPCIDSSVYIQSSSLSCGTAKDQLDAIIATMDANNMHFRPHIGAGPPLSVTGIPTTKPTAFPTQAPSSGTHYIIQRLFVCIEDEVPNRYMSQKHKDNVEFLLDFDREAHMHGIQLGVFTTKNDWLNSMTDKVDGKTLYPVRLSGSSSNNMTETNPFHNMPLWTPRYDSISSMAFYAPFGDWTVPFMKQTTGSTTALHRIGSDRVGTNYVDGSTLALYNSVVLQYIS
jgi:hypothetical protein